jgi:hypothetical protein
MTAVLRLSRELRALSTIVGTVAALAGCNGLQGQTGAPVPPAPFAGREAAVGVRAASGDLLYVAHAKKIGTTYRPLLSVLTFPGGKHVATITLDGFAAGVCSDRKGNVWVVEDQSPAWNAYEFAHGGTKPIAELHITDAHDLAGDCAVDPTTGNLAILTGFYEGSSPSAAAVEVWADAKGKPTRYPVDTTPVGCAYDDHGNLFLDGYVGDTVIFELGELAKGSSSLTQIAVKNGPEWLPGGVAWDGKYVDVVSEAQHYAAAVFRIRVSGKTGDIVGVVHPTKMYYVAWFALKDGMLVANGGAKGQSVSLWSYPGGGKRSAILARYPVTVRGLAISAAR